MKQRAWLLYLLFGYALLCVWEFVPGAKVGPLFNAIAISSPVAIVIAVRMWKPSHRAPWYLFALGQTLFVAGDVITYNYERFFHQPLPYPSIGDVAYLAVYPCLVVGVMLMIRRRSPGKDREGFIDSLIVAIGVGTVSWVYVMGPIAASAQGSRVIDQLVGMAYPSMDLILLIVVVRLAIGAGRRNGAFYLMAAAALALFITDFVYGYISVQGIVYNQAGYLEAGWATFYLLWGGAALNPSIRSLSERHSDHEIRLTRARLVVLGAASLTAQIVRIIQLVNGDRSELLVLTLSTIALFILVVIRMWGLVHKVELSFEREKALRTAGATLVTATNRAGIYDAAMQAVNTLVPDGSARLLVIESIEAGNVFTVVAASDDERALGWAVRVEDLPPMVRGRLLQHEAFQMPVEGSAVAIVSGLAETSTSVFLSPLFLKGELNAVLAVGSRKPLPRSTCDSLLALSSQVALALDSAALTEDLLRRQSEARFGSLVQNSSDVVMVVDADTTMRYISPSVERVLGYSPANLDGAKLSGLISPEDRANFLQFITGAGRDDDRPALAEFRMLHYDDFWIHVEMLRTNLLHDENVRGIVLNTRDISERKAFEEQLQHQAFHDPITNLANRALFRDRVQHALERQARDEQPISVLFMDLDDFKTINDSLGHVAGDQLLREVGERLRTCLRTADTAARLGGDEFAVLLEDGGDSVQAAEIAQRILNGLQAPFHLENKDVFVRASIGIATSSSETADRPGNSEELLRNADVAMYMAKESGKGRYQIFEPAMHDTALRRLELKADLQRAIDKREFVLHYQPVIELRTGDISGVEALLRWNHPQRGMVAPLEFIPLAEETGLIVAIGHWVIEEACNQAVQLHARYPMREPLHMAVNLSARQLQRPEIAADVAGVLMKTGLDPSLLILEITESVMMRDVKLSLQRLTELKELGVKLAVDDFGTGYSSLNYIQQFPVDILKVDKSFIDAFNTDQRKSALTATIIKLAEDLELRPVAEGIERADQLEKLLDLRCDLGQGYYFAKPLPLAGIDELLTARTALADRETEVTS